MAVEPSLGDQLQLAETRRRQSLRLSATELRAETLLTVLGCAATVGLWLVRPPGHVPWREGLICLALMVLAMAVRFETPFGYTVATQVAFVPLAFVLPVALLPVAATIAVVVSMVPDVAGGRLAPARLLRATSNSCFALGPSWVLALCGPARSAGPAVLVAALAAQFATDFVVSTVCCAFERGASVREQLSEVWWVWAIDGLLSAVGLVIAAQATRRPVAVLAEIPLLMLLAMFARERTGRLQKLIELNETYKGTALLLGDVVEADDDYTGTHSQGVVALALGVGAALGLDDARLRNLEFAALLHDVGKIRIPKEIINKPGPLDDDEWVLMRTHAEEGQRMLARVGGFMSDVGRIVRSHHERWDGRGYPDGLVGDASPLESRIITCCDSWSAMRTDRPYRAALQVGEAIAEIVRHAGAQFDPRIAQALLSVVAPEHDEAPRSRGPSATTTIAVPVH